MTSEASVNAVRRYVQGERHESIMTAMDFGLILVFNMPLRKLGTASTWELPCESEIASPSGC